MKRRLLTALGVAAATNVGLGWYVGFRSLASYFEFWCLCALVVFTSVRLARRAFGSDGLSDTIIRSGVLAFGLIVLCGLTLGTLGLIATSAYGVFFVACWAASWLIRGGERPLPQTVNIPIAIAVVLAPIVAVVLAVGIMQSPPTLYDSLSYHLFFPARWLQEHRLFVIATPFSDEAQAYAPANGELFLLWLMLPFHGDVLARIGQFPFFVLCGVLLYALARRMGAKPVHAMYAPAFYFLAQQSIGQAVGADVDLICWAMFLASLHIGIAAVDSDRRRDWALWGISLGLYFGSKYVSLVYSPVFLLLPLTGMSRGVRFRAFWALPGICVLALPWYLRNWALGGSPIYPSSLAIAGLTIAQGAYSRAVMANSVLHTGDLARLPPMLSLAFGGTLFLFWIPFALLGGWRVLTGRPRWPNLLLVITPVVMAVLYWYGVPDNLDSRFLLPVVMMALLLMPFVFRTSRTWNACVHAVFAGGLLWLVSARHTELPVAPLPWPTGNWLSIGGMVAPAFVLPFLGLAGIAAGVWVWLRRIPERAVPLLVLLAGAGALIFVVGSKSWCAPDRCQFLEVLPTYIHAPMLDAWEWMDQHVTGGKVAYTGNNLPYPLMGDHLGNRVYYVNIDAHADWRFHDYDLDHRAHPGPLPAGALAVSSGLLKPLSGPARWRVDAVRPRYERMEGDRDAWIRNLKALGVNYLFVTALSAYEVDFVRHNDDGLPIEDDWARADPAAFPVVYEGSQVRIFAVHLP